MPGFPNFQQTVSELKSVTPPPQGDYAVTIAVGDSLIIREALVEQWSSKGDFKDDMEKVLTEHNSVYNKKNLKRGADNGNGSCSDRPTKKLCVATADTMTLDEYETKFPDR